MKSTPVILYGAILLFSAPSFAEDEKSTDRQQISAVFENLTAAWRSKNGQAWGEQFVDDADFTVWFGLELKGKEEIGSGHQYVFDQVYPDAVFELQVRQVRFLGPDTALVHLRGFVTRRGEATSERPDAVPLAIVRRAEDRWKIVAFQNTPFIVPEMRESMPLGELRQMVAEYFEER